MSKRLSMMASLVLLTSCGGSEESYTPKAVKPDFIVASPPTGMTLLSGSSPSSNPNPKVKVTGISGSVVEIFTSKDCSGKPLFVSANDTFILPALKSGKYNFFARTVAGSTVSPCSERLMEYWSLLKLPMSFSYGEGGLDTDIALVVASDVDGDGFSDYVFTKKGSRNSGIVFGTGESRFSDLKVLSLPQNATAIKITDMDGDNLKDVLLGDNERNLHFFKNNGGRLFTSTVLISMGTNGSGSIDLVDYLDLNGDRLSDYLLHTSSGKFYVKMADPDGGYFDTVPLLPELSSTDYSLIDFNLDRQLDLVVREGSQYKFYANGAGTFTLSQTIVTSMPKGSSILADLNEDGYPEIISLRGNELKVKMSTSHGSYGLEKVMNTYYSFNPIHLKVKDVNGDEKQDLIFQDLNSQSVVILKGNSDGTLQAPILYPIKAHSAMLILDINQDGKADVFTQSVLVQD